MITIANYDALLMVAARQAVLVDVREPAEFYEGHLSGAINLPSTKFNIEDYRKFDNQTICLVCQSGNRAGDIAKELRRQGLRNVFLLEHQMESLHQVKAQAAPTGAAPTGWSIDRQFRMTLGLLLLTFLLGYTFVSSFFLIIPVILCAGLIITSILDRCYLRVGIAMLPWNRNRGLESESGNQTLEFLTHTS
ncbi:MAG: rhodanese-like domain-containing protein [Anaerolineae bacterium]